MNQIRKNSVSPARFAAYGVLRQIAADKSFSAILLPAAEANLKIEDRALCHEITLGVLRNQTFLDAYIEHFSGKKIAKLDLPVLLALRIGLYQILFLTKIPARAAVNESVNLVYAARLRSAAPFANAVLRRAAGGEKFDVLAKIENSLDKLSIETSHPRWLLNKWQSEFGFNSAAEIARANNRTPPTSFRSMPNLDEKVLEELKNAGATITASNIAPAAWRVSGASQKVRELVARAEIYVQDEASQLVAHVCSVKADEFFLDVCAAPGSKTSLIAALRRIRIENTNFKAKIPIFAGDFSIPRIKILRETVEKFAPEQIKIVQYDATKNLPFENEIFDCVLVDAPCSGTGTIRHNPEIRWHLHESDFAELAVKQLQILNNAAAVVKRGGRLIYSTCSLEREENEAVINRFLIQNSDFERTKINISDKFLTDDGYARTFPNRDDADGFFIAAIKRN